MTHRPPRLRHQHSLRRSPLLWLSAAIASLVLIAGCGAAAETRESAPNGSARSSSTTPTAGSQADAILDTLGVSGLDATQVIDALERKTGQRQRDVLASVRYDSLVLQDGPREATLQIPEGRFYLSVAPYLARTHECFFHSLTTCTGELAEKTMQVTISDSTGKTLVNGPVTTHANGFVGFWLPRDMAGSITVSYGGRTATSPISTGMEAPTCLTTLQLT